MIYLFSYLFFYFSDAFMCAVFFFFFKFNVYTHVCSQEMCHVKCRREQTVEPSPALRRLGHMTCVTSGVQAEVVLRLCLQELVLLPLRDSPPP